jgi:hypothetical protein
MVGGDGRGGIRVDYFSRNYLSREPLATYIMREGGWLWTNQGAVVRGDDSVDRRDAPLPHFGEDASNFGGKRPSRRVLSKPGPVQAPS